MIEILKKYLEHLHDLETIDIDHYNIDGANCEVTFYTDISAYHIEHANINVWDMVKFLNTLK